MDEMSRRLGEVAGELKGVNEQLKAIRKKQDEQDERLRKQETKNAVLATAAGAISGFCTILAKGFFGGGSQT